MSHFQTVVETLSVVLLLLNYLGFLAPLHWAFDLFVHFKFQYFLASLVLAILCLATGSVFFSLALIIVALGIWLEIRAGFATSRSVQNPAATPNFTVLQYNKFYFNKCYGRIGKWLRQHEQAADIFLVNESLPAAIAPLKSYSDVFPHQYPTAEDNRFNNISILSKHPVTVTPLPFEIAGKTLYGSKIIVHHASLGRIVVYAFHAPVPAGFTYSKRRNEALKNIAALIREEGESRVLLAGDWNLTPYSSHFKDIIKISGLNHRHFGLIPPTTWPSFAILPFLKIPIDHILFGHGIDLVDLKRGPANGSDHHSLIGRFHINSAE